MPIYSYRGRNKRGRVVQGTMEVATEELVAINLTQNGITPITIKLSRKGLDVPIRQKFKEVFGIGRVRLDDLELFCRQMHSETKAGIPLVRAVRVLGESTPSKELAQAALGVVEGLEAGYSLSRSMQRYPLAFPALMLAMVDVGENTGRLEEVFNQLAVYFQKDLETRKMIKTATRYPTFVGIVIIIAVGIINVLVIPAFAKFFANFDTDLPLPTRILIGTSNFTVAYWQYMILLLVMLFFAYIMYSNSEIGRPLIDRLKLRMPLIGIVIERGMLARFARTFSMTVQSGVPMLQSLTICARAVDNIYVSEHIMGMRSAVERGESFELASKNSHMFTPLVLQMIAIGEETGSIDKLLLEVAEYYEKDVDYRVRRLGDAIEPILIMVIASFVLILALGVFLPMWDLANVALGKR